jgi:hypothetical protein
VPILKINGCLMGIFAGLLFLMGLAVSLILITWGIAAHRRAAAAAGKSDMWFRFALLSVGLTSAMIIVALLVLFPGSHGGSPTGQDYVSMLLLAGFLGMSPGVGVRLAASLLKVNREANGQSESPPENASTNYVESSGWQGFWSKHKFLIIFTSFILPFLFIPIWVVTYLVMRFQTDRQI